MKLSVLLFTIVLASISYPSFSQKKPAYQLFNAKGKKTSYKKMLKAAPKAEVVLFGEFHNNPISHWLQLELIKDLQQKNAAMSLGAEMFEADQQAILNLYLAGEIDETQWKKQARLWPNYATDYAPLVDFAKKHQLPFTATNIPRKFASKVFKEGGFAALDSLEALEKSWIAPLPIPFDKELKTYQAMLDMMGAHATEDIVKAQAIKDATMAHFILQNKEKNKLFVHFNGAYHSNYYEGIYWYLKTYQEEIKIVTIATVEQDDLSTLDKEYLGIADFIICVPTSMTKTY